MKANEYRGFIIRPVESISEYALEASRELSFAWRCTAESGRIYEGKSREALMKSARANGDVIFQSVPIPRDVTIKVSLQGHMVTRGTAEDIEQREIQPEALD